MPASAPAPLSDPTPARLAFYSLLETGDWGASEYLWSQAAALLADAGHPVLACVQGRATRPAPLHALSPRGVRLLERRPARAHRLREFFALLRGRPDANPTRDAALRHLARFRPGLVLVSAPWVFGPGTLALGAALRRLGLRHAWLFHTHAGHRWPDDHTAARQAAACQAAAATCFVSEDNRRLFVRQTGLPADFGLVVRNPLAVSRDHAPPWPSGPEARLACVGRLDPAQKGQDLLLDCLSAPAWRERPFRLDLFGDGPARATLEHLARDLPPGRVRFRGHLADPGAIWTEQQILVLPSRHEGLGLVVAEAQLCGRPVVVTDCAARELVEDGRTGFIAPGCTASALSLALARAWAARDAWPAMGAEARRSMLSRLPADPAGDFASLLLRLSRRPAPPPA